MLGYDSAAAVVRLEMAREVYADPGERQRLVERGSYSDREYDDLETTWKRKDGRLLTVQLSVRAARDAAGRVEYYETFARDVTERRRLQQQVLQSQKMEAVGRLAGGGAPPFHNPPPRSTSYTHLAPPSLPADPSPRDRPDTTRQDPE